MSTTKATNITWHEGHVGRPEREALLKQRGATLWFTGLSASGKSTIAFTLEHALIQQGRQNRERPRVPRIVEVWENGEHC